MLFQLRHDALYPDSQRPRDLARGGDNGCLPRYSARREGGRGHTVHGVDICRGNGTPIGGERDALGISIDSHILVVQASRDLRTVPGGTDQAAVCNTSRSLPAALGREALNLPCTSIGSGKRLVIVRL